MNKREYLRWEKVAKKETTEKLEQEYFDLYYGMLGDGGESKYYDQRDIDMVRKSQRDKETHLAAVDAVLKERGIDEITKLFPELKAK